MLFCCFSAADDDDLDVFWDREGNEKYEDDERGPLVAGIHEASTQELVTLLITIQKMASGYQEIQDMIATAEDDELKGFMDDEEEEDEDDDF